MTMKRKAEPTPRQAELLEFMLKYQRKHGMPPTMREMLAGIGGNSTNLLPPMLQSPVEKGLVLRSGFQTSRCFRAVTITPKKCPHCGKEI